MGRFFIKLNNSFWPKSITKRWLPCDDPTVILDGEISGEQFSKAISVFKFGTTYKTTQSFRFPKTVEVLKSIYYNSIEFRLN